MEENKRQPCEIYSRINGYFRPIQSWNDAKKSEWEARVNFSLNKISSSQRNKDRKTFKLNEINASTK